MFQTMQGHRNRSSALGGQPIPKIVESLLIHIHLILTKLHFSFYFLDIILSMLPPAVICGMNSIKKKKKKLFLYFQKINFSLVHKISQPLFQEHNRRFSAQGIDDRAWHRYSASRHGSYHRPRIHEYCHPSQSN